MAVAGTGSRFGQVFKEIGKGFILLIKVTVPSDSSYLITGKSRK